MTLDRARRRWRAAVLTGVLYSLSFPPANLGPLAFVALVPLLRSIVDCGVGRAFVLGWLAGTIACSLAVSASIAAAADAYFHLPPWQNILFALVAPQIYGAVYFGLFSALASVVVRHRRGGSAALLVASAWVSCEWLRSTLWHGAPWLLIAHSQYRFVPLIQVADLGGTAAVGFVVASVNGALAAWLDAADRRRALGAVLPALAVAALALLYGLYQTRIWQNPDSSRSLRVGLIQGNIPARWRATLSGNAQSLQRLTELTSELTGAPVDLVVWPENAIGFAVNANPRLFADAASVLRDDAHLLIGAPRVVAAGNRASFRNSAHLVDAHGEILASYDKLRLTPYAEYMPLPFLHHGASAGYLPGDAYTLFETKRVRFATMICFEAIYPRLARTFVAEGAQLLINISNDDWFGGRAAIEQHFVAALFRSVENRRYLIRVTNTGISAVVDARGVIVEQLPAGIAAAAARDVAALDQLTFYARYGDLFAGLCVTATVLVIGLAALSGSRQF